MSSLITLVPGMSYTSHAGLKVICLCLQPQNMQRFTCAVLNKTWPEGAELMSYSLSGLCLKPLPVYIVKDYDIAARRENDDSYSSD